MNSVHQISSLARFLKSKPAFKYFFGGQVGRHHHLPKSVPENLQLFQTMPVPPPNVSCKEAPVAQHQWVSGTSGHVGGPTRGTNMKKHAVSVFYISLSCLLSLSGFFCLQNHSPSTQCYPVLSPKNDVIWRNCPMCDPTRPPMFGLNGPGTMHVQWDIHQAIVRLLDHRLHIDQCERRQRHLVQNIDKTLVSNQKQSQYITAVRTRNNPQTSSWTKYVIWIDMIYGIWWDMRYDMIYDIWIYMTILIEWLKSG